MKFQTKAKDFATAINTVLAVHGFGESTDDRQACLLTASADGLVLESAKLGAYCSKSIEGKLLRAGSVGLNAQDLAGMKLKGTITIDATDNTAKFQDGKTAYRWAVDDRAQQDIEEQRNATVDIKPMARVPTGVLLAGTTFATFASEVKGNYDVQVTIRPGYFEYCGIDHFGLGRYEFKDASIHAREDFHFILGNSILTKVVKEATADEMAIGVSTDGSLVRLSSSGLNLWHPAVDKRYQDISKMIATVTKNKGAKCVFRMVVQRNELKDAIERVAPVSKKSAGAQMVLVVDDEGVASIRQHAQENAAVCRFEAEVKTRGAVKILLRAKYLKEFIKVAPSVPLTVESWNEKYLRIMVRDDPGLVDYLAMMV